jgi:hypothetical protein
VKAHLLGLRGAPVESYFMKANAPDGSRALWLRSTIFRQPGLPIVAESWAIAFDRHRGHVAIKSTIPFEQARFAKDAIDVEVDGCALSTKRAKGSLASGRGTLTWSLDFGPPLAPAIVHLPALFMYRDGVRTSKLVTPVADARAEGTVKVERNPGDVDLWSVDGWPMMIGHNWGRANAELYAWTHCNAWELDKKPAKALVFEAVSSRVRMGPVLSPMITMVFLRWRGKSWNLSGVRSLGKNRGHLSLRRWEVTTDAEGLDLACDIAAETDDVVGLHYPNPVGPMTYCFNTKLARARLDVKLPDETTFTALSRAAALEIGSLEPDHSIKMVL